MFKASEQQLLDCETEHSLGCDGGYVGYAFDYLAKHGVVEGRDYPYRGSKGSCRDQHKNKVFKLRGDMPHRRMQKQTGRVIRDVLRHEPFTITGNASSAIFQFYSGGVIGKMDGCPSATTDHAMTAVGFGVWPQSGQEYILIRNSWGPRWGDNGYVRVEFGDEGSDGVCGTFHDNNYPISE